VKNEYFLVTTPLEETWPKKKCTTLFLGEWCRLYSRKSVWRKMKSEVVPFNWDNREKLFEEYQYSESLTDRIMTALTVELNNIHGVNHSKRYWRILIGPWLYMFLPSLQDRWKSVETALSNYSISETVALEIDDGKLVPQSMHDFCLIINSDIWNHKVYLLILDHFNHSKITRVSTSTDYVKNILKPFAAKLNCWDHIKLFIEKISSLFPLNYRFVIVTPYLSMIDKIKLYFKLKQIPVSYFYKKPKGYQVNEKYREWSLTEFPCENKFEKFVVEMVQRYLPRVYLEGYKDMLGEVDKSSLPNRTNLIWTSNSYFMDDRFKLWAAGLVDKGVPLVIGQHGGHYGQGKFSSPESHEMKISDIYLSWGWVNEYDKVKPVGIFKGVVKRKNNSKKNMLLLMSGLSRYCNAYISFPVSSQWLYNFEELKKFYSNLDDEVESNTIVRLYPHDFGWSYRERWLDSFPNSTIGSSKTSYRKLLRNSSLTVSNWNSTTYLESMASNIPTVIFWTPEFFELREDAVDLFDDLKKVGIFHDNPLSASKHINKIWHDIDAWWDSIDVVTVRKSFVKKYANSLDVIDSLSAIFKNI